MASAIAAIQNAFQESKQMMTGGVDANNVQRITGGVVEFIGKLVEQSIIDRAKIDTHEQQLNSNMLAGNNMNAQIEQLKAEWPGQLAVRDTRMDQLEERLKNVGDSFNQHQATINNQFGGVGAEMQKLAQMHDTLAGQMTQMAAQIASINGPAPRSPPVHAKAIMEFKAISNLRSLKSKAEFRLWNDRLISALDQARPKLRNKLE